MHGMESGYYSGHSSSCSSSCSSSSRHVAALFREQSGCTGAAKTHSGSPAVQHIMAALRQAAAGTLSWARALACSFLHLCCWLCIDGSAASAVNREPSTEQRIVKHN